LLPPLSQSVLSSSSAVFVYDFTIPKTQSSTPSLCHVQGIHSPSDHSLIAGMIWQAVATLAPQQPCTCTHKTVQIGNHSNPCNLSGVIGGWILPSLPQNQARPPTNNPRSHKSKPSLRLLRRRHPNHKYAWMIFQMFGQCCFTWVTSLAYIASGLFVRKKSSVSQPVSCTFRSAGAVSATPSSLPSPPRRQQTARSTDRSRSIAAGSHPLVWKP